MAHDIIIILDVIDTLIGTGCSATAPIMDLREAVVNANTYLTTSEADPDPVAEALHEALHDLQIFLVNGCEMEDGLVGTVVNYTNLLEDPFN